MTTVDTQLAKSYLEASLAEGSRHDQTKVVRALRARFDQRTMSWELLRDLTHETSVDFATLYFIRRALMDQRNAQWQSRFAAFVRELRARSELSSNAIALLQSTINVYSQDSNAPSTLDLFSRSSLSKVLDTRPLRHRSI